MSGRQLCYSVSVILVTLAFISVAAWMWFDSDSILLCPRRVSCLVKDQHINYDSKKCSVELTLTLNDVSETYIAFISNSNATCDVFAMGVAPMSNVTCIDLTQCTSSLDLVYVPPSDIYPEKKWITAYYILCILCLVITMILATILVINIIIGLIICVGIHIRIPRSCIPWMPIPVQPPPDERYTEL